MITLLRAQARLFRAVLRKSAPLGSGRSFAPPLSLHASEDGLLIQAHHAEVAVAWRLPGPRPPDTLTLPGKALEDFEAAKDTMVELARKDDAIVQAKWHDGVVPQEREYSAIQSEQMPSFPAAPARFAAMNPSFLKALDDAAQTAARENIRYGLTRLQLRGLSGEIIGTNGRHLLVQRGFVFPWKEDVLIPSMGVFGSKELALENRLGIGRTETHVCVRAGAWQFHVTIDKEARFPRIENVIPAQFIKGTCCKVAPADAAFLLQALPRLPARGDDTDPATVDLTGPVAVRIQDEDRSSATELVLTRSEVVGPALRFVCDRKYLLRAMKLGFTEIYVKNPDVPIVCRDPERLYVFAPLSKDGAILPSKDASRIESAVPLTPVAPEPSIPRRIKAMPAPQPNGHTPHDTPEPGAGRSENGMNFADLLTEAEELRTVVLDASSRLGRLISGLKQHRRHSRAVQDAVRSLKQLRLDA